MAFLIELWLPIVASAAAVFLASSIFHMLIPIHKNDYGKLPNEDHVLDELRKLDLKPGAYMFPACESMKDLAEPETVAKFERGPVGHMTVLPSGPPTMGKALLLWFLMCLAISTGLALVAHKTIEVAPFIYVFQVIGVLATMVYCSGALTEYIWKGQSLGTTLRFLFDGVVYGLTTGAVFAWFWPSF